jgi:hypothetical protein
VSISRSSGVSSTIFLIVLIVHQIRQSERARRFDRIYRPALEAFRSFLIRYPMLGGQHPFGRVLFRAISNADLRLRTVGEHTRHASSELGNATDITSYQAPTAARSNEVPRGFSERPDQFG